MKYNIFVLYGGKSVEHEISLKSATAIINSIDGNKYNIYPVYIDKKGRWNFKGLWEKKVENPEELILEKEENVSESISKVLLEISKVENPIVFPVLHGPNGEDGTIQGLLEMINVPYIGCGVLASSVAMDKAASRDLFHSYGLPQTDYFYFYDFDWEEFKDEIIKMAEEEITFPVYVKPANLGSSVGISRVGELKDFEEAVEFALKYDRKIIVEKELVAREMQVAILGNENPRVSLPGEFEMEDPFFDYDTKYLKGTAVQVIPAKLDEETTERVRELALDTYEVLNCTGITRVDIFVDENNNLFVNEANTLPGFTPISMTPVLWEKTDGTTYPELVEELIQYGIDRFEKRQSLKSQR